MAPSFTCPVIFVLDTAQVFVHVYFPFALPLTCSILFQSGCGAPLKFWLDDNKAVWCSVLAVLGGLQLMSIVLCIHIIHKLKDKTGYKKSSEKRRLHDEKGTYSL